MSFPIVVWLMNAIQSPPLPPPAVPHRSSIGHIRPAIVISSLPQPRPYMSAPTSPHSTQPAAPQPSHFAPATYHLHYHSESTAAPHSTPPPPRSPVEHHPAVSSRLCLFFRTLLLTRDGLLSFEEYCSFYVRLSKLLLAPHFQLAHAKATAQAEWDSDMRKSGGSGGSGGSSSGERSMECDTFCHSLFEMMDMFVLLHDVQQLVFILNKAYALLTQTTSSAICPAASSSSSSAVSSAASASVVTFLPLASINALIPFNSHDRHNVEYNQYAHAAAHSLHHQLHDNDIEFTVPLLPPLSVDPLSSTAAVRKECVVGVGVGVGGLKQGPTRTGLHCSIGAMDEFITLHSPYTAMLPAQWSVARWQRDNQWKQQTAARMAAVTLAVGPHVEEEEKQNTAADGQSQQQWRSSATTEEPFVVREMRERAASRAHMSTVTLGGGRRSDSSSRRGSVVMDIDDSESDSMTAVQRGPQCVAQRLSRFL